MKIRIPIYRYKSENKGIFWTLMVILVFSHKCFYLWLQDTYMISSIKYSDIGIVWSILFTGIIILQSGLPREHKITKYVYFYMCMVLISAITGSIIHDQSLFRGIFAQRMQIGYFFLMLGVVRLFELKKISRKDIEHVVEALGWFELILCTVQYIVYEFTGQMFLVVGQGIRYEGNRFYFEPIVLLMSLFHVYNKFLSEKKHRVRNLVFLVWAGIWFIVITKMRAMTLAYLLTLVVGFLIWKGTPRKKLLFAILGVVVVGILMSQSTIVQDVVNAVFNLGEDANYGVRISGRSQMLSEFAKTPITGRGYPSVSSESAQNALRGYLFVDNGVWGIVYSYGIIGILWVVFLWIELCMKAWRLRKKQMAYFLYFCYYTIGFMTDFSWFWIACCPFSIMVAMMMDEETEAVEVYGKEGE